MDVSSLGNANLTDYYSSLVSGSPSSSLDAAVNSDYSKASDDELMDACKQFESYFVEQMFKEMQNSVDKSRDIAGDSSSMQYYEEMLTSEYANMASEQGGIGIAQMMYEQMQATYQPNASIPEADEGVTQTVATSALDKEESR